MILASAGTGCYEGDLRLVGGSSEFEGRVEICLSKLWGTICDDGWDDRDAEVVCRQLGHITTGARALGVAVFGQGMGSVHLHDVACTGSEEKLTSCPHSIPREMCEHFEDASVLCQAPEGKHMVLYITINHVVN